MDEIIKQIRNYLNMSQTEFAELMNVSFGTVNRWENGRAVPNNLDSRNHDDVIVEKNAVNAENSLFSLDILLVTLYNISI